MTSSTGSLETKRYDKAKLGGRKKQMFIRVSLEEEKIMIENAERFSGGNLTKWVRDRAQLPMITESLDMQDRLDKKA